MNNGVFLVNKTEIVVRAMRIELSGNFMFFKCFSMTFASILRNTDEELERFSEGHAGTAVYHFNQNKTKLGGSFLMAHLYANDTNFNVFMAGRDA